jgi:hypothetical protein
MVYRKDDHPAIQKALKWDENPWYDDVITQNETWIHVSISEANYGLMSDRENIAFAGIPFFGWHGSGGDYESCVFAAADEEIVDVMGRDEVPWVGLRDDGSIDPNELRIGKEYHRILRKAKEQVYMKINGFYSASPDLLMEVED